MWLRYLNVWHHFTGGYAWKLLPYLQPYRLRFGWALLQVFLVAGFDLLKPWPLQLVLDGVLAHKPLPVSFIQTWPPLALLALACVTMVLVQLGSAALTLLHNNTGISVGQSMVNDLQGALYSHLQRLSLNFHGSQKVGDLMLRITGDSFAVQTMLMNGLLPIVSAIVLLGGILVILFPLDPTLTLLSIVVIPPLFVLIGFFNRRIADVATHVRDADSQVFSLLQWAMSSIKVIQAFTKEEDEYVRFMGASRTYLGFTLRLYNWQSLYTGAVNTLIAGGTALVVYMGARSVLSGQLSVGHLIVFISYLAQLYVPVNQLTQSWGLIAGARISAHRVFEILETEAELKDGSTTLSRETARGAIEWRGVSFQYRSGQPILRSIDLRIEPGMKVAVVGPTGTGKSTLLSLLPRFLEPSRGSVMIDELDVREFTLKSLRQQIAMVLQPPLIFPISVRDNLTYGRPQATQREIERAARLASIDKLIESLPHGYDTVIGESGATLSEGEKQRLTIARAILRDSPILILALRDGVIAEHGTFSELMRREGIFRDLYSTQFNDDNQGPRAVRKPQVRKPSRRVRRSA